MQGGAGGSRTLVQTGKPYAFYTLIPAFGFRVAARPGPPTATLSSKFHPPTEALTDYSRFVCTAYSKRFGTTAFERCLVPSPGDGIKPIIYCASIRQRERNCFRQLNCWSLRLWSQPSTLRVLTYHFIPLSNPVNPILSGDCAFGQHSFKCVWKGRMQYSIQRIVAILLFPCVAKVR